MIKKPKAMMKYVGRSAMISMVLVRKEGESMVKHNYLGNFKEINL